MSIGLGLVALLPLAVAIWMLRKGRVRMRSWPLSYWGPTREEEPVLFWMQVGLFLLASLIGFFAAFFVPQP